MPIDNEPNKGNLFYMGPDGVWRPFGEASFQADITVSEEVEAMFWAQTEGLEIVKRSDAE